MNTTGPLQMTALKFVKRPHWTLWFVCSELNEVSRIFLKPCHVAWIMTPSLNYPSSHVEMEIALSLLWSICKRQRTELEDAWRIRKENVIVMQRDCVVIDFMLSMSSWIWICGLCKSIHLLFRSREALQWLLYLLLHRTTIKTLHKSQIDIAAIRPGLQWLAH